MTANPAARFAPEALTDDTFLDGSLRVLQPRHGYRAAADPVFLAAAVPAKPGQTVLELGCGAGVASLCLARRVPGLALAGLELQPAYADLARQNAARNGLALDVYCGDLAAPPAALRRSFDHVLCNPPYFPPGGGTAARDGGRECSRREAATPLAQWLLTARRRLLQGGWLTLIQSAERLPQVIGALDGFGSVSVLPLAPRGQRPAGRFLLRARKGGGGAFRLLAPLVLHDGPAHDGDRENHTPEVRAILRQGAGISRFS